MSELYTALSRFHSKITVIPKDTDGRFPFASLPDVVRHITPILAECGLEYTQTFDVVDGNNVLVTTLVCCRSKDSESVTSSFMLPKPESLGGTNINHAIGGSITYFRRYTLCALLGLVSDTEDTDGETVVQSSPRRAGGGSEKQIALLKKLLKDKNMPEDSILKSLGVDSLEELPWQDVRSLIDKLK